MPRYMVQRNFADGLNIPVTAEGAAACLNVVVRNAELGVTCVHSCVSEDKSKTYCVYDGPSPEAIRQAPSARACRWTGSARSRYSTRTSLPLAAPLARAALRRAA